MKTAAVALRKESVDRNLCVVIGIIKEHPSLSARRAWIEILSLAQALHLQSVALRKESVDRNLASSALLAAAVVALRKESVDRNPIMCCLPMQHVVSLSARRAWIEM